MEGYNGKGSNHTRSSPHPHLNLHSQKGMPEAMTWALRFIWEMISESESEEVGRSKSDMIKL